jgi:hypothetical protein
MYGDPPRGPPTAESPLPAGSLRSVIGASSLGSGSGARRFVGDRTVEVVVRGRPASLFGRPWTLQQAKPASVQKISTQTCYNKYPNGDDMEPKYELPVRR